MSDLDRYLTDELIARVADVLDVRRHDFRVDTDTWRPHCICGWSAEESHDVAAYDRHLAVEALKASAPLIAAQAKAEALRKAAEEFWARLPDGTGNGRAYNSHRVADMLRARADQIEHDVLCPHPKCPGGGLCCCLSEQGGQP